MQEKESKRLLEGITALLQKCFGDSEDNHERHAEGDIDPDVNVTISKAVDEELKQATFLVLAPDEVDLHGDIYDADEIRKGCHNFQTHCQKANLFHMMETDLASIVENYIAPSDFYLDDTFIKKGSWLQVWQVEDDDLWDLIKKGEVNGVSIGCMAEYEVLDDES